MLDHFAGAGHPRAACTLLSDASSRTHSNPGTSITAPSASGLHVCSAGCRGFPDDEHVAQCGLTEKPTRSRGAPAKLCIPRAAKTDATLTQDEVRASSSPTHPWPRSSRIPLFSDALAALRWSSLLHWQHVPLQGCPLHVATYATGRLRSLSFKPASAHHQLQPSLFSLRAGPLHALGPV